MEVALRIVDEEVGDAADIELAVEVAGCVDELVAVHRELLHLFEPWSRG